MSEIFKKILKLIKNKDLVVSNHGYDELSEDNIWLKDLLASAEFGVVVEDYPDYPKGPCVLILQQDSNGAPIHVVWGIPKGRQSPAVLITAYRPDRSIWSRIYQEKNMRKRRSSKLIRENQYVVEVNIELMDAKEGWAPYMSLDDALKLDDARSALRRGDLEVASQLGRLYSLTPVDV